MTQKSLGQIAWECAYEGYGLSWDEDHSPAGQAQWERIAQAVAEAERERICAWLGSRSWNISCMDVAAAAITHEYAKGVKRTNNSETQRRHCWVPQRQPIETSRMPA